MISKEAEGFEFKDNDIVTIAKAVVVISEGYYVTIVDIAENF